MLAKREARCEACGTLNRVRRYSIGEKPRCGKCRASLPEQFLIRIVRWAHTASGLALIGIVLGLFIWAGWNQMLIAFDDLTHPAASCIPHPQHQGVYRWYTADEDVASFTIKTEVGSDYFVKLEDLSGQPVRSFFVYGGSTFTTNVPLGTFVLKYATGKSWCNERDLFGPSTSKSQADDTFAVERKNTPDGYTLSRWTVELIRQPHGNLRTHSIARSKF